MNSEPVEAIVTAMRGIVRQEVAGLHTKVDQLDTRVGNLQKKVDHIANDMETIKFRMLRVEGSVNGIGLTVSALGDEVERLSRAG